MRTGEFWKKELKFFTVRHPQFSSPNVAPEEEEQIFTPKEGYLIRFWIEGNLQIIGGNLNLEINFNNPELLVLSLKDIDQGYHRSTYRIPFERVVCFELIIVK